MWWGNGGRFYWGRREPSARGIVVLFAWMSSEEKHVRSFLKLYGSLGWNSLVCHADFVTLFFPEKASSLAVGVLQELVKETKIRKLPIVFSGFSGGPKGAMYKLFQIIERKSDGEIDMGLYDHIKECACGQIYDSSPVDFNSDLGTRFVLHPSVLRMSEPPKIVSWTARKIASGLDSLFLHKFEEQRADYWKTLYSSTKMGPVLILCSENDELAPFNVIENFVKRLKDLGSDVTLIKWASSPHVGHYKHHPTDYQHAVAQLLDKATECYAQRVKLQGGGTSGNGNSVDNCNQKVEASNHSNFSSIGELEIDFSSPWGKKEEDLVNLDSSERVGRILSDICSPKIIESWDIMHSQPLHRKVKLSPGNKHRPLNGIQRSRL